MFLDEPTTGMDPVTRRSVWDMIEAAKRDRVILDNASMEEAELGDRYASGRVVRSRPRSPIHSKEVRQWLSHRIP